MTFLAPWLFYGFGALLAPIAIHLWQRKRVVKVPFSTLRFLKVVAARTSRSAKLENLLLLLLRCLIFVLLILAAARPLLSTDSTKLFSGNVPRSIALVIDESLSMTYKSGDMSRLERAKDGARAIIDDLKPGDEVVVIAVSDRARLLIGEPTVDHAAARQAINSIQSTEGRTDFSAALKSACKAIGKTGRGVKEIFLFTDNQENGWQFEKNTVFDETWKRTRPQLAVVRPDALTAINATVSKIRFETPFAAPDMMTRGVAVVENHSASTLRDLLEIKLGEEKVAARPVEVAPGSSMELPFEFQMPALSGRWAQGTASLSGDNLEADDRRYFTLAVYQTPRLLVVESGEGPEKTRPGFYLRKALTAGARGAPLKTVSPAGLDDLSLEPFSAIFLAGVDIGDRSSVQLNRYIEAGGTVVFFPGDLLDAAAVARLEWMPAEPEKIRDLPAGRLIAQALEPRHPLFINSWDANTPFPALPQRKLLNWKLGAGARVILTLGDHLPFIIFAQRGSGRVIIVNASADRSWGDFPLTSAFLPLMQQIGRLSVSRTGRESEFLIGDPVPAPPGIPRDQPLTLKPPAGDAVTIAPGAALSERAGDAGFYSLTASEELYAFAVNLDAHESDLTPISEEALNRIVPHESIIGLDALHVWLAQNRGLVPLWPLFLALALMAFATESIYSNLLARRRSQSGEARIRTGRLNQRRLNQLFRAEEVEEKRP
ncbi:MAG: hypothetical protein JWL59_686 [Chthoniobacteraceae bacterium]|nr:hypothetical protein [Chthoniobacteraceae bacterium]